MHLDLIKSLERQLEQAYREQEQTILAEACKLVKQLDTISRRNGSGQITLRCGVRSYDLDTYELK
jgi:hypothetical protein